MKHKASVMRYFMLAMLTVACAVFCFVGCKKTDEVAITWTVDEHATVAVEGYTELPATVEKDTSLVFTVTCASGYEVDSVKSGTRNVTAKDGQYTVKVSGDTTITVTTKRTIQSIDVTKNPTKLTYFAGDVLDKTGMEVKVVYAGDVSETLKDADYRIVYQGGAAAMSFSLGDTWFKVSYGGKESDQVDLDSKVVAVVELDLDGGTLTDAYVNGLKANTELKDVKTENGVLSFHYEAQLTKAVALPTASDISKGEHEGDYDFTGWSDGVTTLAVGSNTSYHLKASFAPNLVRLTNVRYEMKENVPYLILEGRFQLADNFFLYLYEGNDVVEVSDEAGEITGTRGQEFTYEFDLRNLVDARTDDGKNFSGKWMDIKIVSGEGEERQVMDIDITRYPDSLVDTSSSLRWTISEEEEYVFTFKTHTPNGTTAKNLKTVFKASPAFTFTVKGGLTDDGLPTLIIEGTAKKGQFNGQYVRIDIESMTEAQYALVENDKWSMTFVLGPANLALNTVGYMHFNIVEKETDGKGSGYQSNSDNNLDNEACKNTDMEDYGDFALDGNNGYLLSGKTLRIANADDSAVYYIGAGAWGGFIIYGVNENRSLEFVNEMQISLKVDNMTNPTKVYYVFYVRAKGSNPYSAAELKDILYFGNIDSETQVYPCDKIDDMGDGIYRMWYNIIEYKGSQLWSNVYYKDEVAEGATQTYTKAFDIRNATAGSDTEALYVIVGTEKWSIKVEYSGPCIVYGTAAAGETNPESADPTKFEELVKPEPKPEFPKDASYTLTDVDLVEEDGKPYFVLKGTYTGCTQEQLKAELETVWFDFETNANMGANGWNRKSDYPRKVETTDTGWTIKVDVSSLTQPATPHFTKTGDNSYGDIKLDTTHAVHDKAITVGGFEYKLFNKPECTDKAHDADHNFWGNVGLMVKDQRMEGKDYTVGTADLVVDGSKVYYTAVVTLTGFTADELAKLDEIVQFGDSGKETDMYKSAKHETVDGQANTYKFYFDITDRPVSGDMLYAHLFVYTASKDVKDATANGKKVTLGSKTYSIKCVEGDPKDGGTWGMSNLIVSNEA